MHHTATQLTTKIETVEDNGTNRVLVVVEDKTGYPLVVHEWTRINLPSSDERHRTAILIAKALNELGEVKLQTLLRPFAQADWAKTLTQELGL